MQKSPTRVKKQIRKVRVFSDVNISGKTISRYPRAETTFRKSHCYLQDSKTSQLRVSTMNEVLLLNIHSNCWTSSRNVDLDGLAN